MAKDPVCGMDADPKTAAKAEHMGQTYYFCCADCKAAFEKEPGKYTGGQMGSGQHGMHQGGQH